MVFGNGDGDADNTCAAQEDEGKPPASPTAIAKGEALPSLQADVMNLCPCHFSASAIDGRCEIEGGGIKCGGDSRGGGGGCEAAPGGTVRGAGTSRHTITLPWTWLNAMAPPGTSHCCQRSVAARTTACPPHKYLLPSIW